jgi:hypothetical protein
MVDLITGMDKALRLRLLIPPPKLARLKLVSHNITDSFLALVSNTQIVSNQINMKTD